METGNTTMLPNPRDGANIFSILTFAWTIQLFRKGYKKVLGTEDLFRPKKEDFSEILGDRLEKQWRIQESKPNPSLMKATIFTFWREYSILGVVMLISEFCVRLSQPLLLGKLLMFFRKNSTMSHQEALYIAGGIVVLSTVGILLNNQYLMECFRMGMKIRVAMCSIIYRKSLKLSRTAYGDTAPGKIVNLLSNDVNRFDLVSFLIHYMWSAPLMTVIVGYFLYLEAGWSAMVGGIIVLVVVPVQSYTGKLSSRFRHRTALRTDERVRFMDEIISGVQVIKLYAWEIPFSKLIQLARKMELKVVKRNAYVRALYMTCMLFTTRMAIFVTITTIMYSGQELTASKVFVVLSYFAIITQLMSQMFVRGVAEIAEVFVAFNRLQRFLTYSEKGFEQLQKPKEKFGNEIELNGDVTEKLKLIDSGEQLPSNIAISIKNASARWNINEKPMTRNGVSKSKKQETEVENYQAITLNNINIEVTRGKLIGVVGPVGSGKSSLLQTILRELPLQNGYITVEGELSYASQEPWVFTGSVRQNILFGDDMQKSRYDKVVKACALVADFEQFPYGDKSLIGERGASLSGGQRARINLARAVYRQADTYLLDDPLSAVDAHVGRHMFDSVIGPNGRLAKLNATRILVTHQVHYLKDADWIVVIKDGKVEFQGTPFELRRSGIDIAELLDNDDDTKSKTNVAGETTGEIKQSQFHSQSSFGSRNNSLSSSKEIDDFNSDILDAEREMPLKVPVVELEQSSKGIVKGSIPLKYFKAGGNFCLLFILFIMFALTQIAGSVADWWVSFWTSQEELRNYYLRSNNTNQISNGPLIDLNETSVNSFNETMNVNQSLGEGLLSTENCMIIHGSLVVALFIIAITRAIMFYDNCIRSSQNLHDGMFKGIISTTMRFFDTNTSGRILNRFAKDMGSVDELLPKAILDSAQMLLSIAGAFIVTVTTNPIFVVPLIVLGLVFVFLRKVYLKSSTNIKRVETITRSPVFSHLAATLTGLSTIRAFDAQNILIKEFDSHQDLHSGAWFMFISASTAFGFALDVLCIIFIAVVAFGFLLFDVGALGDKVGLAITQSVSICGFMQWGVRQSAEVTNFMMSVERLIEYQDLPPEPSPKTPLKISKAWPSEGKLEFRRVFYRYYKEAEPVLRELSFTVQPTEKIGIVGRTGAGKSSLIGSIFRLAMVEGEIFIDDIETSKINIQTLRSKVSIIPQDPVLFSGTLRRNLDPFEEFPDALLWKSLDEVELKDIASGPLGLQSAVLAGGSNFSVGQRQLLCLARAILRNNKLLVLDEATANVDPQTDLLIQRTIRQRFADCTVLTIAHRLHTIMDSDRVLVMHFGKAEEFGTPYDLLQKPTGPFKEMVLATGTQESERLIKIALEAMELKKKEIVIFG